MVKLYKMFETEIKLIGCSNTTNQTTVDSYTKQGYIVVIVRKS